MLEKIRLFHLCLAGTCVAAIVTGEAGLIHAWIGYAVAMLIALRVVWGLLGPAQVKLARFVPDIQGLLRQGAISNPAVGRVILFALVIDLLIATGTGIALGPKTEKHAALQDEAPIATGSTWRVAAFAGEALAHDRRYGEDRSAASSRRKAPRWIKKVHEATGNLILLFVALHVGYLLLFRRPLVRFMLFMGPSKS